MFVCMDLAAIWDWSASVQESMATERMICVMSKNTISTANIYVMQLLKLWMLLSMLVRWQFGVKGLRLALVIPKNLAPKSQIWWPNGTSGTEVGGWGATGTPLKKSACIYSQLKTCSSSEVAAMIEGLLRHCTDMKVEKNYVDTHGQSEIAFGFCRLLGFALMPRIKPIGSQKLSLPTAGQKQDFLGLATCPCQSYWLGINSPTVWPNG